MKQFFFLAIFLLLFVNSTFASINKQEIVIYSQVDSPLQLSKAVPKWRISKDDNGQEFNMLRIEFLSHNVSNKAIRAYTIRQFKGEFYSDLGLISFSHAVSGFELLKSNQFLNEEIGESSFLKPPQTIKLAVDFVEFSDGSTWGHDLSKSSERLAGVRVGEKITLEYFKKIYRQSGIKGVSKALNENIDVTAPENKNGNWVRGFQDGIEGKRKQIKVFYENGIQNNTKTLETELNKPTL